MSAQQDIHRPVVGIMTYGCSEDNEFCLPCFYVDGVRRAGGLPILFPPGDPNPREILNLVDALIFTGGGDLSPEWYGGDHHPTLYMVDPERDTTEVTLAQAVLQQDIPVLGICRGMQVLGVASGAKLVAHIPEYVGSDIAHRTPDRKPTQHEVSVLSGTRLATLVGDGRLPVVSWHHQAVERAPKGWRVAALAPDGVIEAMEAEDHPWLIAVQWHPELALDDPRHQRLFDALVEVARQHRRRRRAGPTRG